MKTEIKPFGKFNGRAVDLINLRNSQDIQISITNYGCIVTSLKVPDRNDDFADIVLGFDNLEQYVQGHPFFGAIAGRFANRIHNGEFKINDQIHYLEKNELFTMQHLHGGSQGFDKYVWAYDIEQSQRAVMVHFHRVSVAGESGYPGNLNVVHTIGLDEDNQVYFNFQAITDKTTIINLANHSYYNLCGHNRGNIEHHRLKLFSDFYTPTDERMIPTGEIWTVSNTGLDFRNMTEIGENMQKLVNKSIDHNFVLRGETAFASYNWAAELYEPNSGRLMTVITTQPAVQVYNGSKLSNKIWIGKGGYRYESFAAICFETQHFPDSPNHCHFPTTKLEPNQIYSQKTIHRFSVYK